MAALSSHNLAALDEAYASRHPATQDVEGRTSSAGVRGRRRSAVEKTDDPVAVLQVNELSEEDRRLAELGYVQVYKREFSWLSCVSFAFSISGLFASVSTTYVYPLMAGGAASAVWCWLISGAGCMCIAISVAELVSAYPTSGAVYFTCKYLAPDKWVPEISWACGWFNLLGQIAGIASTEYGCAQLLLAAVSMNSDFSYVPTAQHTVGVMAAITLLHGALNSMNTKYLERTTRFYVIFHLAVLISCCIALLVKADKHDSTYVWTDVTPVAGWSPPGWSFLFGFLSVSWTMTDYDATAHIAEEIKNPEIKAPWAITMALAATYIGGWLYTIVLTYCSGDIESILASPIAQPAAQIFYNVLGRSGGVAFTCFAFVILNFTGITALQAAARTLWAFSRDEMMPLSRVWYKINRRTQTPLYAVWVLVFFCIAIDLIGLGSYTAISAIFSMTAIALDWSYCIPIICKMAFGRFERGPFHLGKLSWFINFWAVLWTTFVSIIFILPPVRPVTIQNMNYVSVILVGVALFALIYWYAAGRRFYIGPRVKAQLIEGTEERLSEEEAIMAARNEKTQ